MKNPKINEALIIGVDFSKRDDGVLIVGRQKNGDVTIINAFQGKEAFDIYKKLNFNIVVKAPHLNRARRFRKMCL